MLKSDGKGIPFGIKHFEVTAVDNERRRIETILKMEPCNGGMLVVAD